MTLPIRHSCSVSAGSVDDKLSEEAEVDSSISGKRTGVEYSCQTRRHNSTYYDSVQSSSGDPANNNNQFTFPTLYRESVLVEEPNNVEFSTNILSVIMSPGQN